MKKIISLIFFGFSLFVFGTAALFTTVLAANVTSTADLTLRLSDPAIDFTLLAGAKVDKVVVGTGNVVITVPVGGSFTLNSGSRGLNVTGADIGVDCTDSRVARTTVTSSTETKVLTITPTASQCGSSGGSGGSGVWVPILQTVPITPTTTTAPVTIEVSLPPLSPKPVLALTEVRDTLNTLVKEVEKIKNNLGATNALEALQQVTKRLSDLQSALGSIPTADSFKSNLSSGARSEDVKNLQSFLKSLGSEIYPEGLVTGYFGSLTKKAVGKFQLKYGVISSESNSSYGFVGPKTRAKINELLGL